MPQLDLTPVTIARFVLGMCLGLIWSGACSRLGEVLPPRHWRTPGRSLLLLVTCVLAEVISIPLVPALALERWCARRRARREARNA